MTKFLIIGDLHGNMPKIYNKDFDAIIAPGDFCSDALRKYMFQALKKNLSSENPEKEINWHDIIPKLKAKSMVLKSLKDGRKILKFLNSFNKPVFTLPGNWDWTGDPDWKFLNKNYWKSHLIKSLKNIKDCHKETRKFQGLTIIGHGITSSPEYPIKEIKFRYKTNKDIKAKKKEYYKLFKQMSKKFKKSSSPIIFLTHNVPYNTKIDKIINKSSLMNGKHIGSYLARDLIIKHSPLVCVGGHMHEHFGKTKLKNTLCINAGFGSYVNTILEIKNNKITNLQFIQKGKTIK